MTLSTILADISASRAFRPQMNSTSDRPMFPLRKAGTPKHSRLISLPKELRDVIYQYLFTSSPSTLNLHYYRPLPPDPLPSYLQPDTSRLHLCGRFSLSITSASPFPQYERSHDRYALLSSGTHGITQACRMLRHETLALFLAHTTFGCTDELAMAVFTTHFPPTWRPHVQSVAGWFGLHATVLPTDHGQFPVLRRVELQCPRGLGDRALQSLSLLHDESPPEEASLTIAVEDFKSMSQKELEEAVLAPVRSVSLRQGQAGVVDAFMLVRTMPGLEWVVKRECLVHHHRRAVAGGQGRDYTIIENVMVDVTLEAKGPISRVTRRLKVETFRSGGQKAKMTEDIVERWGVGEWR
ncbi:uncharacterized protein HMPREF1541_02216 [Cyphellophora europaea CBS 101466]|uniref:F-box domain-containing protein n=1 Tax=Cyphellophora europaea (strain CBS 101466) TaxID=1220924 RepID=W2S4T8_CYPE1|nr:uncharacterized protein HMPREF1541_02216 [Cyphellophora europaea CBS 101466]ETN43058.1 hypothetical protein HMPREF1541_02216 [Cyphellophora europaea CBS 101466]